MCDQKHVLVENSSFAAAGSDDLVLFWMIRANWRYLEEQSELMDEDAASTDYYGIQLEMDQGSFAAAADDSLPLLDGDADNGQEEHSSMPGLEQHLQECRRT